MLGDGYGESGAFFGIGGGTQFVEQDQRVLGCGTGDEVDVGDVGGERGEILLDGLIVADVGEDGIEDGQVGAVSGDWDTGLRHQREQAQRFQGHGFAAGVGAGDDELAAVVFEFDGDGNDLRVFQLQVAFERGWRPGGVGAGLRQAGGRVSAPDKSTGTQL